MTVNLVLLTNSYTKENVFPHVQMEPSPTNRTNVVKLVTHHV